MPVKAEELKVGQVVYTAFGLHGWDATRGYMRIELIHGAEVEGVRANKDGSPMKNLRYPRRISWATGIRKIVHQSEEASEHV